MQFIVCDYCYAMDVAPPHGVGNPCPLRVREVEALSERLDAERMSLIKKSVNSEQLLEMMQRMMEEDE